DGPMQQWYVPIGWRPEMPLGRWCLLSYPLDAVRGPIALAGGLSLAANPNPPNAVAPFVPPAAPATPVGKVSFSISPKRPRPAKSFSFNLAAPATQMDDAAPSSRSARATDTFSGTDLGRLNLGGSSLSLPGTSPMRGFGYRPVTGTLMLTL